MVQFLNNFLWPALLAILTAVLGYGVSILKENRKTGDANAKGTMLLLRREIIKDHYKYVILGETMSAFDYDDLNEIHNAYKALGGNGLTEKMYEDLKNLELSKGE